MTDVASQYVAARTTDPEVDDYQRAREAARRKDQAVGVLKQLQDAKGAYMGAMVESTGKAAEWFSNLPANGLVAMYDAVRNTGETLVDALQGGAAEFDRKDAAESSQASGAAEKPSLMEQRDQRIAEIVQQNKGMDLDAIAPEFMREADNLRHRIAPTGTADVFTQKALQFAVPFAGTMRMLGSASFTTAMGADALVSSTVWDPHESRFADLLMEVAPDGSLNNTVIDYLASDPQDSDATGRFKNVLDSQLAGLVVAGFIKAGAGTLKAARDGTLLAAPKVGPAAERGAVGDLARPRSSSVADPVKEETRRRLDKMLEDAARRYQMEGQGQAILDDLVEKDISPRIVGEQFWKETYPLLNEQTQLKFQRQVRAMGFQPGDVLWVEKDGRKVTGDSWEQLGQFLSSDLAPSARQLDGGERGFVALMQWANNQLRNVQSEPLKIGKEP